MNESIKEGKESFWRTIDYSCVGLKNTYFLTILTFIFSAVVIMLFPGSNYYVRILSTIDRELLKPSASVALHKHSNALVDVLPPEADSSISMLQAGLFKFISY